MTRLEAIRTMDVKQLAQKIIDSDYVADLGTSRQYCRGNGLRNDRLYPYEIIKLPEVN